MKGYSTVEVARMVGIQKGTLRNWLQRGAIPEPKRQSNGGQVVRIWTARDVERVRKYKAAHYRKGRGRKKKGGMMVNAAIPARLSKVSADLEKTIQALLSGKITAKQANLRIRQAEKVIARIQRDMTHYRKGRGRKREKK